MAEHPVARWHRVVRMQDSALLNELLADDAVFYSPVVHTAQVGRKLTSMYLTAAFKVFSDPAFHYVREIVGASDAMLEFETVIDGTVVNGVDLLKWNASGRLVEFKVMLRPLQAVNRVRERMAAMLRSQGANADAANADAANAGIAASATPRSPPVPKSTRDVIVRTQAFATAIEFYGTALGFEISSRSADLVSFETGSFRLYVEPGEGHGPVFELLVPDVAAAKRRLMAAGCVLVEENPAVPRCYLRDPYGFTFNLGRAASDV